MNKIDYAKILIVCSISCVYLACAAGTLGFVQPPPPAHESKATPVTAETKSLFAQRCARCHGEDGRGETTVGKMLKAPNFTSAEWQRERADDKALIESVANGKARMPAFKQKLTDEQIAALVVHVRSFKPDTNETEQKIEPCVQTP